MHSTVRNKMIEGGKDEDSIQRQQIENHGKSTTQHHRPMVIIRLRILSTVILLPPLIHHMMWNTHRNPNRIMESKKFSHVDQSDLVTCVFLLDITPKEMRRIGEGGDTWIMVMMA